MYIRSFMVRLAMCDLGYPLVEFRRRLPKQEYEHEAAISIFDTHKFSCV